ncbi:DUF4845 domain-containing protein [Noviherbaspirillum humi]|uniref:DUF4845 domain-containing protein n=1 Tax=Noviherbaspirillum humi TaxID=1688639 RepID=UPI001FE50B2B|nr:DUF4845 domain-containing protein [Noviherbaspirillum humi]
MSKAVGRSGHQSGLSLVGFLLTAMVVGALAVLALRIVPTITEYMAVKKAITSAKASANSAREIQAAFDRQRDAGYIESVSGKDLEITRSASGFEVSVAYQRKIGLIGPASLVLDYVASTDGRASKAERP